MISEKQLPLYSSTNTRHHSIIIIRRAHHFGLLAILFVLIITSSFVTYQSKYFPLSNSNSNSNSKSLSSLSSSPFDILKGLVGINVPPHQPDSLCPIVPKLDPTQYLYNPDTLSYILTNKKYHKQVQRILSDAVKIPTEIYDGMENPKSIKSLQELYKFEPRWKPFEEFHKYLKKTYPLIHKHLHLKKINKFGLIYTWKGTNPSKSKSKPIMLMAHQDVVPVPLETIDQWTYPPFDGKYDGKFMYGRGVSDCKNLLIGLMNTIELLLSEKKFKPERTIILAFGYDEEAAGIGAQEISQYLIKKYGPDSILQIIDEGDEGFQQIQDVKFILPATGEKGHLNSIIELFTPGGHSSIPPQHTSIGIMAQLITRIENHDFNPILSNVNPILGQLYCLAEHSSNLDKSLKSDIIKSQFDINANEKVIEYLSHNKETKFLIQTSQAIDIIQGGIKSNALPEHVSLLINSRIAVEESVTIVVEKFKQDILTIADKFDLGVIINNQEIRSPNSNNNNNNNNGYFNYSLVEELEPAPVSPINGKSWEIFGGSLRYLFEDLIFPDSNDTFVVAPFLSSGNTDTKSYWDLTRNIYRYQPNIGLVNDSNNIHSIDEKLLFEGHLQIISYYYFYLQLLDTYDDF